MVTVKAFGAGSKTAPLAELSIPRREPLPDDVEIEVLYCGVCHSDLHLARSEWAFVRVYLGDGSSYHAHAGHGRLPDHKHDLR